MGKLSQTLVRGAAILLMAALGALLMKWLTPSGGIVGVGLWAVFFATLLFFPPRECATRMRRPWGSATTPNHE